MRLVCPNCEARYEVDESAIPATGRNVQCANCGETWFQHPAPALRPTPLPETEFDEDDEAPGEAVPTFRHRRPSERMDPSVLDILRSEAEREAAARSAETEAEAETADEEFADDRVDEEQDATTRKDDIDQADRAWTFEDDDQPADDDEPDASDEVENHQEDPNRIEEEDDSEDFGADEGKAAFTQPLHDSLKTPDHEETDALVEEPDEAAEHSAAQYEEEVEPAPHSDEWEETGAEEQAASVADTDDEASFAERARAIRSQLQQNREGERPRRPSRDFSSADQDQHADSPEETRPAPRRPERTERPEVDLPDIANLNATLRSSGAERADDEDGEYYSEDDDHRPGAYRLGFYLAVLIALCLIAIYLLEEQIAQAVPQAAPYVHMIADYLLVARHLVADGADWAVRQIQDLLAKYL